jgi:hypothetical protein
MCLLFFGIFSLEAVSSDLFISQEITGGTCKQNVSTSTKQTKTVASGIRHQLNIDYYDSDFYAQGTIYSYINKSDSKITNENYNFRELPSNDVYFKSLYMSYSNMGIGVLSLSDSVEAMIIDDLIPRGEGLFLFHNISLPSVFIKSDKYTFIHNDRNIKNIIDIPYGDNFPTEYYPQEIDIVLYDISDTAILEMLHSKITYNNSKLGNLSMIGMGSFRNGILLDGMSCFASFGISHFESDMSTKLYQNLLIQATESKKPLSASDYNGAAISLGFRYDYDAFNNELFSTIDVYQRFGDWVSLNIGQPQLGRCDKTFNADSSIVIGQGYVSNDFNIVATAELKQYVGKPSIGFAADRYGIEKKRKDIYKVIFRYKF